ncbi:MAG: hypothetical protein ACR2N0_07045 [Rubrobacteraceae bacterium]
MDIEVLAPRDARFLGEDGRAICDNWSYIPSWRRLLERMRSGSSVEIVSKFGSSMVPTISTPSTPSRYDGKPSPGTASTAPTGVTPSDTALSSSPVSSTTTRSGSSGTSDSPIACSTVRVADSSPPPFPSEPPPPAPPPHPMEIARIVANTAHVDKNFLISTIPFVAMLPPLVYRGLYAAFENHSQLYEET